MIPARRWKNAAGDPNRLARGEHADVVIMVGDALTSLEKAGRTQPDSRRELADSPIGVVVKAGRRCRLSTAQTSCGRRAGGAIGRVLRQRQRTLCQLDAVPHRALMTRCRVKRRWWSAFRWPQVARDGMRSVFSR